MPQVLELIGGTDVSCVDGACGTLGRLIIDPESTRVTHLSVEPKGLIGNGRLVPTDHVSASAGGGIRLDCTTAEFASLAPNEVSQAVANPGVRPGSMNVAWVTLHEVPSGELEVNGDENILATDGKVALLRVLAFDGRDFHFVRMRLDVGRFRNKRQVAIPVEMISAIDSDGVHLTLSKSQLESL